VTQREVYVDIGAVSDGVLQLPRELVKQFRIGDEVHGMVVDSIDVLGKRITVTLEDPELEEPLTPGGKGKGKGRGKSKGKALRADNSGSPAPRGKTVPAAKTKTSPPTSTPKGARVPSTSKAAQDGGAWAHPDGFELGSLSSGDKVSGTITNVGMYGVFIDVGAVKDALLPTPKNERKNYRKGEKIQDLVVDTIDVSAQKLTVSAPTNKAKAGSSSPNERGRRSAREVVAESDSAQTRTVRGGRAGGQAAQLRRGSGRGR